MANRKLGLLFVVLAALVLASSCMDLVPVTRTTEPDKKVVMPPLKSQEIYMAFLKADQLAQNRITIENNLPPSALVQNTSKSVEARHQRFLAYKNQTAGLDQNNALFNGASRELSDRLRLSKDQTTFGLKHYHIPNQGRPHEVKRQCEKLFHTDSCDVTSVYRTMDGSCNNLKNPAWGRSFTCMGRLVHPDYQDGVSIPRHSQDGTSLPNPRTLSVEIHEALETQNGSFTHMLMQFGQFVNHDVTMGLMTRTVKNPTMMSCCPFGNNPHPECLAIKIPKREDDFYSQHNQTCMNFVRSATCTQDCALGPRQHSNQITSYVDASNVYGSVPADTKSLRSYKDGLLLSQEKPDGEYLPANDFPTADQCTILKENRRCFKAGDRRVNEQLALSSIHTIWMRQHNRLARLIKKAEPSASDEEVFQRTRRIVIAQIQNIAFKEYLPALIGANYMDFFFLNTGADSKYDETLEATIFNEFMSAANRFGHTLVQNTFQRRKDSQNSMNLDEVYFLPFLLMEGELDPILEGLSSQPGKQFDPHLVTAVTHTMYREKEVQFGMDLAALNIQRGRDQGTAGYTQYLQHCFNWTVTAFEQLDLVMPKSNWMKLKKAYSSVEDVDLFTGGVSETRLSGAVVGPTFGCIEGIQFYRLKFGDRFFFEHADQVGSFTKEQLHQIRKTTFAQILCENTGSIQKINHNVFLVQSEKNPQIKCSSFPKFDLSLF